MLYFIVRNGSPIVSRLCVNCRLRRGIDSHRLSLRSNRELHIDCVRLLWNQLQLKKVLLLETVLGNDQAKLIGRQRIKVVDPAGIAGADLLFAGAVVGEGQVGARNHGTRRIGYHALDRGAELGMQRGTQPRHRDHA